MRVLPLVFALGSLLFAQTARADEKPAWKSEWPKVQVGEIALAGGLGLEVGLLTFLYTDPSIRWRGGFLFDDSVRDATKFSTRSGRETAASVSDGIYYGMLAYPLVVDLPVAFARGGSELGLQMLGMDLESFALAGAISITMEKAAGRARPMEGDCASNPQYDRKCGNEANLSAGFVSGHTAISYTGAGLICAHHTKIPLYGGGAPDIVACIGGMAAATAEAVLRLQSDNHYLSDIVLGGVIGVVSGYAVPTLLHYRGEGATVLPTARWKHGFATVAPMISPTSGQLSVVGVL